VVLLSVLESPLLRLESPFERLLSLLLLLPLFASLPVSLPLLLSPSLLLVLPLALALPLPLPPVSGAGLGEPGALEAAGDAETEGERCSLSELSECPVFSPPLLLLPLEFSPPLLLLPLPLLLPVSGAVLGAVNAHN